MYKRRETLELEKNLIATKPAPNQTPVYLSEATRLTEFKKDAINWLFYDVGGGKTTYIGKKLPSELNYEGAFIFLSPYLSLKQQTIDSDLFEDESENFRQALQGFYHFDPKVNQNLNLEINKQVTMTAQSFFWLQQSNPHIWDQIGVLIIDEVDHVLFTLPIWGRNKQDPFKKIVETLKAQLGKTYIIGLTATNTQKILTTFKGHSNVIQFLEPIKQITLKAQYEYTQIYPTALNILSTIQGKSRLAVFVKRVSTALQFKQYFIDQGYTAHLLVSNNANIYTMNEEEAAIKRNIEKYGTAKFGDILIFNATLERGVSITDTSFSHVIVHDSNPITQTQVFGRFRYDGVVGYTKKASKNKNTSKNKNSTQLNLPQFKENLVVPDTYLDVPLTTKDKENLCLHFHLLDERGRIKKWVSIKALLTDNYLIQDKRIRIEGKQQRVSVITPKPA